MVNIATSWSQKENSTPIILKFYHFLLLIYRNAQGHVTSEKRTERLNYLQLISYTNACTTASILHVRGVEFRVLK